MNKIKLSDFGNFLDSIGKEDISSKLYSDLWSEDPYIDLCEIQKWLYTKFDNAISALILIRSFSRVYIPFIEEISNTK